MSAPELSQETIRQLLHYDPVTGIFTWLHRDNSYRGWNTRYAGKTAGSAWKPDPDKPLTYWVIRVMNWPFLAHRLAVLYMTGKWPEADTDHVDTDGLNNRWDNLRPASKSQNGANRTVSRSSKSGIKGVRVTSNGKAWSAAICGTYLGTRPTPEEAAELYRVAAIKKYGEFARSAP